MALNPLATRTHLDELELAGVPGDRERRQVLERLLGPDDRHGPRHLKHTHTSMRSLGAQKRASRYVGERHDWTANLPALLLHPFFPLDASINLTLPRGFHHLYFWAARTRPGEPTSISPLILYSPAPSVTTLHWGSATALLSCGASTAEHTPDDPPCNIAARVHPCVRSLTRIASKVLWHSHQARGHVGRGSQWEHVRRRPLTDRPISACGQRVLSVDTQAGEGRIFSNI